MPADSGIRAGVRAALPFVLPTLLLGVSFGVLAKPVMGAVAPIVMSVAIFSGGAQFAALGVLASGGALGAAIAAGVLMNARWMPMGFAIGPSLPGGPLDRRRRALRLHGGPEGGGARDARRPRAVTTDGRRDRARRAAAARGARRVRDAHAGRAGPRGRRAAGRACRGGRGARPSPPDARRRGRGGGD